jgi:hypothetical protein
MQGDEAVAGSKLAMQQMSDVVDLLERCGLKARTDDEFGEQIALAWAWVVARNGWQERFRAHPR